ncbi:hypothetical protein BU16DRAFT_554095 [Lophium mytilinum]|uniref:Uncharacterized protein n=1 Tax=Lophium mytilinum TaxID=390894 RepID=A0A6A6RCC4_9PEZI|nr:hypothetical protein BU16DRAFT_554095 [Lophium mytilinum]
MSWRMRRRLKDLRIRSTLTTRSLPKPLLQRLTLVGTCLQAAIHLIPSQRRRTPFLGHESSTGVSTMAPGFVNVVTSKMLENQRKDFRAVNDSVKECKPTESCIRNPQMIRASTAVIFLSKNIKSLLDQIVSGGSFLYARD